MNLEDVIDPEYGLQQDEWSLASPIFGDDGQLGVVGWSGRNGWSVKYYIVKCSKCTQDSELFGEGYFKSLKDNLLRGKVPCGCSKRPLWSKEQFVIRCYRKSNELGYSFLGFVGEWKGQKTKIRMLCVKHGEWNSGTIHSLVGDEAGCLGCAIDVVSEARTKPDDIMVTSFISTGGFADGTKFWRTDRKDSQGYKPYWGVDCPECGGKGETRGSNLQKGCRPCACSMHRQQEAYINWITDNHDMAIAIKFGVANNSRRRVGQQNAKSPYNIKQHSVYMFPDIASCKKAERECLQELECGVLLKRDFPDGYTETTWVYNLEKIIQIYERNGGTTKC